MRLTASGLGCPDWPLCDGGVVPAQAGHALIEYSNRILSGIVMAVAVLTWVVARRMPGAPTALRRWSAAIAGATALQVPLGAVTVLTGLHPLAVGSHFLLSMVALGAGRSSRCGPVTGRRAWSAVGPAPRAPRGRRGPGGGRRARHGCGRDRGGPHSGDDDVTERFGDLLLAIRVHVRAAVVFAVLAAVLVAWLWREGADRLTRRLALAAVPLMAIQIALGEYQYRNGLPWEVVVFHVTAAALLWAVVVAACRGVARVVVAKGGYGRREASLWQETQRTASGSALSRPSGISEPQSTQTP